MSSHYVAPREPDDGSDRPAVEAGDETAARFVSVPSVFSDIERVGFAGLGDNTGTEDVVLIRGWSGAGSLEQAGYAVPENGHQA